MKNIALILAGGVGKRVQSDIPKQFIEVNKKPIIIYTLERFQSNNNIDAIVVVCRDEWIDILNNMCDKYKITKFIYLLGIFGLAITFASTVICSRLFGKTEVFFNYLSFNVILYASAVFLLAKNKIKKAKEKIVNTLNRTHFGIYLVHGLVLGLFEVLGVFELFDKLTISISVILSSIVIYLVSFIAVLAVIKIPIVNGLISLDKKR